MIRFEDFKQSNRTNPHWTKYIGRHRGDALDDQKMVLDECCATYEQPSVPTIDYTEMSALE
jgi:hypothetical protein